MHTDGSAGSTPVLIAITLHWCLLQCSKGPYTLVVSVGCLAAGLGLIFPYVGILC